MVFCWIMDWTSTCLITVISLVSMQQASCLVAQARSSAAVCDPASAIMSFNELIDAFAPFSDMSRVLFDQLLSFPSDQLDVMLQQMTQAEINETVSTAITPLDDQDSIIYFQQERACELFYQIDQLREQAMIHVAGCVQFPFAVNAFTSYFIEGTAVLCTTRCSFLVENYMNISDCKGTIDDVILRMPSRIASDISDSKTVTYWEQICEIDVPRLADCFHPISMTCPMLSDYANPIIENFHRIEDACEVMNPEDTNPSTLPAPDTETQPQQFSERSRTNQRKANEEISIEKDSNEQDAMAERDKHDGFIVPPEEIINTGQTTEGDTKFDSDMIVDGIRFQSTVKKPTDSKISRSKNNSVSKKKTTSNKEMFKNSRPRPEGNTNSAGKIIRKARPSKIKSRKRNNKRLSNDIPLPGSKTEHLSRPSKDETMTVQQKLAIECIEKYTTEFTEYEQARKNNRGRNQRERTNSGNLQKGSRQTPRKSATGSKGKSPNDRNSDENKKVTTKTVLDPEDPCREVMADMWDYYSVPPQSTTAPPATTTKRPKQMIVDKDDNRPVTTRYVKKATTSPHGKKPVQTPRDMPTSTTEMPRKQRASTSLPDITANTTSECIDEDMRFVKFQSCFGKFLSFVPAPMARGIDQTSKCQALETFAVCRMGELGTCKNIHEKEEDLYTRMAETFKILDAEVQQCGRSYKLNVWQPKDQGSIDALDALEVVVMSTRESEQIGLLDV